MGIVVVFKVINIRQTDRQREIVLHGAGDLRHRALIHIAAIKQPGQMIVLGILLQHFVGARQFLLGVTALGNIHPVTDRPMTLSIASRTGTD